jgi:thioredoxin-dependent peroxiredoxin
MAHQQLEPGEKAPNFSLSTDDGESWELVRALAKGPVVLFFYPKDDTPGCTAEACTFRDQHESFAASGAQVVGVSSDSIASHGRFKARHQLPYTLLSDPGGKVRKLFGVKKTLGLWDGRVTFVIDQDGTLRHVFRSALDARRHVDEALRTIRQLV